MLRPARASSMMRRRYSGAYGGCVRGIGNLLFYFSPNTVHQNGSTPDRIEADHVTLQRRSDSGQHIIGAEHLQQAQDLHELALAGLAHARLEQTAQGRELFG